MNLQSIMIFSILLTTLSACSNQLKLEQDSSLTPIDSEITLHPLDQQNPFSVDETTLIKSGRALTLVKIMEGGACKNEQQGAIGLFRLYANKEDIARIRKTQGSDIFSDFERQIQNFSMQALQSAIQQLNFQGDSSNQQLSANLIRLFSSLIANDISEFETKTKLLIDVSPIEDSLVFYLVGCNVPHDH